MRKRHPLCWLVPVALVALCTGVAGAQQPDRGEPELTPEEQLPAQAPPKGPPAGQAPSQGGGASSKTSAITAEMGDDEVDLSAQARFEEALGLLRGDRPRYKEAAAALLKLGRDLPADEIAPEALFQAAQIDEEQLRDPLAALALYEEIAGRYQQSRLLRRAEGRAAELRAGLRTGPAAFIEWQEILRGRGGSPGSAGRGGRSEAEPPLLDPAVLADRLRSLLERHPEFALVDQARYQQGVSERDAGRWQAALVTFRALRQRRSEWAPRALQMEGQVLLDRGDYREARACFAALALEGESIYAAAAAAGLAQADQAARRAWGMRGAWGFLGLLAAVFLVRLWLAPRPRSLAPPLEVYYYGPVAGLLIGLGYATGGVPIGRALLLLGGGGVVLTWLGGLSAQRRVRLHPGEARREDSAPGWILVVLVGILVRALAACALCYLAICHFGLLDMILETLRNGPET